VPIRKPACPGKHWTPYLYKAAIVLGSSSNLFGKPGECAQVYAPLCEGPLLWLAYKSYVGADFPFGAAF